MVMVCIIATGLAAYGFVVDVATSPLASYIANANQKSFDLLIDIERAYPAETVNTRFEDRHSFLTVTLVDSAANQLTTDEQKAMAAEIAQLTWQKQACEFRVHYCYIHRAN